MKIELLSKNYSPSEKLKDIISKKVERLDKFFEQDTKVKVLLKQIGDSVFTLELTIPIDRGVLRAEVTSDNMYNNVDLALPKLEKQIIKHHDKIASKSKSFKIRDYKEEKEPNIEAKPKIVRSKSYELTPMTVDDAIEELELVGHSFFVFLNKGTSCINVLYRRVGGDYGLIETII